MGVGDALGLNYQIPQSFIQSPQGQQAPQDTSVEAPEQADAPKGYLAHVEGLTDKYYDIGGKIRSYAQSMAKDYGIDVTKPDFSQPGGGEPFKTYQKLTAALQYTGNDLANSNDIDKTMRVLEAQNIIKRKPGFDPRQQASATMNPDDMFYSTQLDPGQEESNIRTRSATYDRGSSDRLNAATYDQQIQQLDDAVRLGKIDPVVADYQKKQLLANSHELSPSQLTDRTKGVKVPPGITILKKIVNLSQGVWNDGSYKPITKNGKVYLENAEMTGESVGQYATTDAKSGNTVYKPKIIKRWLKDPDTGVVSVEYQDAEVPDEVVSNKAGATATNFIANNSKYGDAGKTMDAAYNLGVVDDSGSVIPEALTPENAEQIKAKVRGAGQAASQSVKARVDRNISQLEKIDDPSWWKIGNNSVEFTLPDGKKLEVKKHRGKKEFYIPNPENYFDGGVDEDFENLSSKDIVQKLSTLGLYDSNLTDTQQPKAANKGGKTITSAKLQSLIGTPGYEGQTLQSLQDYYTSNGYTIK